MKRIGAMFCLCLLAFVMPLAVGGCAGDGVGGWLGSDPSQVAALESQVATLKDQIADLKTQPTVTGQLPDAATLEKIAKLEASLAALQAVIDRAKNPDGTLNPVALASGFAGLAGPQWAALAGVGGTVLMSLIAWVKNRQKNTAVAAKEDVLETTASVIDNHSVDPRTSAALDAVYRELLLRLSKEDAKTLDKASTVPYATLPNAPAMAA